MFVFYKDVSFFKKPPSVTLFWKKKFPRAKKKQKKTGKNEEKKKVVYLENLIKFEKIKKIKYVNSTLGRKLSGESESGTNLFSAMRESGDKSGVPDL